MNALRGGLRRLLANPGLWIGTWIGLVLGAALVGGLVRAIVASAVVPFGVLHPGRVLYGLAEILAEHPAVATTVVVGIVSSAVLSGLAWLLLSPLCIARLAGRPWPEAAARAMQTLPAILVQSLWHLVLRIVVLLALLLTVQPLPPLVAWPLMAVGWVMMGVALDITRVSVCEHDAAPFHIRSTWRGVVQAVRRPGLTLPCALLSIGQLLLAGGLLWLALVGLESGSTWLPRLITLVSVGLGLGRIATVVEHQRSIS